MKRLIVILLLFPFEILGSSPSTFIEEWLEQFPPEEYFYGYAINADFQVAQAQAIINLSGQIAPGKISLISFSTWNIIDGISHQNITQEGSISRPDLGLSGLLCQFRKAGSDYWVFVCVSKIAAVEQLNLKLNKHIATADKIWCGWKQNMTISNPDLEVLDSCVSVIDSLLKIPHPDIANHWYFDQPLVDSLVTFKRNLSGFTSFPTVGVKVYSDRTCPPDLFNQITNMLADLPGIHLSQNDYSKILGCTFSNRTGLLSIDIQDSEGGRIILTTDHDYLPQFMWQIQAILFYNEKLDQNLWDLIGTLHRTDDSRVHLYSRGSVKGSKKDGFEDWPYNIRRALSLKDNGGLECLYVPRVQDLKTRDQKSLETTRRKYSGTITYAFGQALLDYTLINQKYTKTSKAKYITTLMDLNNRLEQISSDLQEIGLSKEELFVWKEHDSLFKYYSMLEKLVDEEFGILLELPATYEAISLHDFDMAIRHLGRMVVEFNIAEHSFFEKDQDSLMDLFSDYYNDIKAKAELSFKTGNIPEAILYASKCFYLLPDKNLSLRIGSLAQVNLKKDDAKTLEEEKPKERLVSPDSLLIQRFINLTMSQAQGSGFVKRIVQKGDANDYLLQFEFVMPSNLYRKAGTISSPEIEFTFENLIREVLHFANYAKYGLSYHVTIAFGIIGRADRTGFKHKPRDLVSSDENIYVIETETSYPYKELLKTNDSFLWNVALAFSRAHILISYIEPLKSSFPVEVNSNSCSVSDFSGAQYRAPYLIITFQLIPDPNAQNSLPPDYLSVVQEDSNERQKFNDFWKFLRDKTGLGKKSYDKN